MPIRDQKRGESNVPCKPPAAVTAHRPGQWTGSRLGSFIMWGVVILAYFILVRLLYSYSLPILGRPGGLVGLPEWELRHRIDSRAFLTGTDCPCCMVTASSSGHKLYGYVPEEELPWFAEPPTRLMQLQEEFGTKDLVTAFRTILPDPLYGEEENIAVAASYIAGIVLLPGKTVSLNRIIGPYTKERGYREGPTYIGTRIVSTVAGGVCKIASTLYNVIIASDLQVVERHPHSMMVPYVPPGRDATVAWGAKDFRFRNNRDTPVVFWALSTGKILYIAMYGQFVPPQVEWHHRELHRQPTWTVKRASHDLPKGATRLIEGYDAVTVKTWITVTYPNKPSERRDLGTDHYRAMPHILEFGS
jgi:vancomycin resistance protein VanW